MAALVAVELVSLKSFFSQEAVISFSVSSKKNELNLLDYTTDDATGAVVSGSKTEPVKFEEYWTFTRPVGNNPWRLSAISQK